MRFPPPAQVPDGGPEFEWIEGYFTWAETARRPHQENPAVAGWLRSEIQQALVGDGCPRLSEEEAEDLHEVVICLEAKPPCYGGTIRHGPGSVRPTKSAKTQESGRSAVIIKTQRCQFSGERKKHGHGHDAVLVETQMGKSCCFTVLPYCIYECNERVRIPAIKPTPPVCPLLRPSSLTKRDERFALIGLTYSPMLLARHLRREKENEVREGHKRRTGQFNKINSAERLSDQMPSTSTPRQTQRQKEGALIARGEAGL